MKFSAVGGCEASSTEVCMFGVTGVLSLNLNMQIIIIFKQGQSLQGTLRTTLLKMQILFAFRVSVIS